MLGPDSRPVSALFNSGTAVGLSDAQLLERLAGDSRAESDAAFAALIARHGPMVLGVCRRTLVDPHDVEDAFQATFLVLVRKAGSVRADDSLGPWLYGVSRKVAGRARLEAARRPAPAGDSAELWPARLAPETELPAALDEEINRLPRRYREAVCMCYLEGLALREAALRIGCPIGTVGSRLSRARDLLKSRLRRRGWAQRWSRFYPASSAAQRARPCHRPSPRKYRNSHPRRRPRLSRPPQTSLQRQSCGESA